MAGTNYFAVYDNNVKVSLTDSDAKAVYAECTGNPNVVAVQSGVFVPGCLILRTDFNAGDNLYQNNGTLSSPVWNLVGTGGGGGVSSVNGLTGAVILAAGANVTLTPVGNTITIAATGGGGSPSNPLTSVQYNTAGAFDGDALFIRDAVTNYTDILKDFSISEQGGLQITPDVTGGNFPNPVPGSFLISEDTVTNLYALTGAGDISGLFGQPVGTVPTSTVNAVYNSVTLDSAALLTYDDGTGLFAEANVVNGVISTGFSASDTSFSAFADDTSTQESGIIYATSTQAGINVQVNATNFETGFFAGGAGSQMFIRPVFTGTKDWTFALIDSTSADFAGLIYNNITDNHRYFFVEPLTQLYQLGDITAGSSGNNNFLSINDSTQQTDLWTTNLHVQSPNALNAPLIYIDSVVMHTRLGYNAGGNSSLLAGGQNTYVGFEAGFGGASGSLAQSNTAVGYRSGYNLSTTGDANSLFGQNAGWQITTGQNNSIFGYIAGGALTTQSENSIFGSGAGDILTSANNAMFGTFAGGLTTTGNNNTFFGHTAGLTNATGSSLVLIGAAADVSAGAFSSSIGIGRAVSINASNQLKFGSASYPIYTAFIGDYTAAQNGIYVRVDDTTQIVELGDVGGNNFNTKIVIDDATAARNIILNATNLVQMNTARIHLNGGQRISRTAVADADVSISTSQYLVTMTGLTADRTATLPDASTSFAGQTFIVKNKAGNTFNVIVEVAGTDTIDGAANITLLPGEAVMATSDGVTDYEIV